MREGREFTPEERDALIAQARDEPTLPSSVKMAGNFAKATVKHIGNGMKKVDLPMYQRRLHVCNGCVPPDGLRVKNRCTHESCGCFIDTKAWWSSEKCPLDKWQRHFGVYYNDVIVPILHGEIRYGCN